MTVSIKFRIYNRLTIKKKFLQTIIFIIFRDSLMFYQIFLSPQVKRCAIITYKHGIHELPDEFPNDLGVRILGK